MITAAMIKEKAKELGAGVCGIGDIKYFIGDDPQHHLYNWVRYPRTQGLIHGNGRTKTVF